MENKKQTLASSENMKGKSNNMFSGNSDVL
jgi:hypothetical protein